MAELLVKARTEPGLDSSDPGVWTRGEVVVVKPDGWSWGSEERPPRFVVVRVPDADPGEFSHLTNEYRQDTSDVGLSVQGNLLARRRYVLDLDSLPGPAPDRAVEATADRVQRLTSDREA